MEPESNTQPQPDPESVPVVSSPPVSDSVPPTPPPSTGQPIQSPPPDKKDNSDLHTLIAVLLLLFAYPIGVIYMFVVTKWPKWVKILVCLPFLLIILGIIAIILSIVLIAANPARQFSQADNTKRRSDVTQILNAIGAYSADHKGTLPPEITTTVLVIGDGPDQANICPEILTTYIPALPVDPGKTNRADITSCSGYNTGYTIVKDANDKVTIAAPGAEKGEVISISR